MISCGKCHVPCQSGKNRKTTMRALPLGALMLATFALTGCASSSRFDDLFGRGSAGSSRMDNNYRNAQAAYPAPGSSDLEQAPLPSSRNAVTSEPLAPLPGTAPAPQSGSQPFGETSIQDSTIAPPAAPATASGERQIIASAPSAAEAPPVAASGGNAISRLSGTWTVTDAGDKCRVTLSSQPLFEYYRASAPGCKSASFAKVNAWEQRGAEVVLLEPGGKVAARLAPTGNGSYSGATARGATVQMSR